MRYEEHKRALVGGKLNQSVSQTDQGGTYARSVTPARGIAKKASFTDCRSCLEPCTARQIPCETLSFSGWMSRHQCVAGRDDRVRGVRYAHCFLHLQPPAAATSATCSPSCRGPFPRLEGERPCLHLGSQHAVSSVDTRFDRLGSFHVRSKLDTVFTCQEGTGCLAAIRFPCGYPRVHCSARSATSRPGGMPRSCSATRSGGRARSWHGHATTEGGPCWSAGTAARRTGTCSTAGSSAPPETLP